MIPKSEWVWFGSPGHFICANDCRFHLCTLIGDYLVSTVGELLFDSSTREILASCRGVSLVGRGDERRSDYMKKVGYEEIGFNCKYETMVFRVSGNICDSDGCNCGLPKIIPTELDCKGYNMAGDATRGHWAMCDKWAAKMEDAAK